MPEVEWSLSGAKDLRFIGREFHKLVEELRNDRQVEGKGTDDLRSESCWEV